ncbi:MAG: SOS response-associated peptidase [Oscillospiraceae bacterium]|nr:SOS response-associated peptidase [Oscillospiraceae bacterium]
MCCRYYMEMSPELRPIVEEMNRAPLASKMRDKLGKALTTSGEVRPTDIVPTIASSPSGARKVYPMLWGFTAKGVDRPIVNARVESAKDKPLWKDAWKSHRCIVPASYYFEWEHLLTPSRKPKTGDKYMIQPRGAEVCYMAGLYQIVEFRDLKYPVFTILTREPSQGLRRIHDRMPVILPSNLIDDWIRPDNDPEVLVKAALTEMVFEKAI